MNRDPSPIDQRWIKQYCDDIMAGVEKIKPGPFRDDLLRQAQGQADERGASRLLRLHTAGWVSGGRQAAGGEGEDEGISRRERESRMITKNIERIGLTLALGGMASSGTKTGRPSSSALTMAASIAATASMAIPATGNRFAMNARSRRD